MVKYATIMGELKLLLPRREDKVMQEKGSATHYILIVRCAYLDMLGVQTLSSLSGPAFVLASLD